MTDFYNSIASNYDAVFPTKPPQVSFVVDRVKPGGRIIDVGCATGGLAVALASKGFRLTGIDLDASMVDLARGKAEHAGVNVDFQAADMTALPFDGPFDGVVCLGNTLVHLKETSVSKFLEWVRQSLTPDGTFVFQILNYYRIRTQAIDTLPVIENDTVRFERTYATGEDGALLFRTNLKVKSTGQTLDNEIPLYPIEQDRLEQLLRDAGFGQIEFFGDLKAAPFVPEASFPLVVSAERGRG